MPPVFHNVDRDDIELFAILYRCLVFEEKGHSPLNLRKFQMLALWGHSSYSLDSFLYLQPERHTDSFQTTGQGIGLIIRYTIKMTCQKYQNLTKQIIKILEAGAIHTQEIK